MPHEGQNERLKKTGIERNLVRSMYMPVVTAFPIFGQRIMSSPISHSIITQARRVIRDVVKVWPQGPTRGSVAVKRMIDR